MPTSGEALAALGLALVVYSTATIIRGWRWHVVMRLSGVDHRRVDAYLLTVVGYMGNIVLPARGGELMKVLLLGERSTSSRRAIAGTIVAERVLDAIVLGGLFVTMTWAQVAGAPAGQAPAAVTAAVVAVGAVGVLGYLRARQRGRLVRFADFIRPFVRPTRLLAGWAGVALVVVTTVVWALEGLIFLLIGRSLGLDLNLVDATLLVVLASFFALVPAAPGYVGTYDAGVVLGLGALGVSGGAAVTFVLLVRFINFVPVAVAGLILLLAIYGGFGRLRASQLPGNGEGERSARPPSGSGESSGRLQLDFPPLFTDFLTFELDVFGEPPPIATYDPYLIRYGEYRFILDHLPLEPGATVVDVGCEANLLMFFLATRGAKVVGVDVDPGLAATVEERKRLVEGATGVEPSLRFEVQDATDLALAPGSVDIVVATSSIEHMFTNQGNGDELAVDGIARALRAGGVAAITVPMSNGGPFHESPYGDERFAGPYRLYTPEVLAERFLSHPDLETLLHNYLAQTTHDPRYEDREFFQFWSGLAPEERATWAWANPILSAVFNPIIDVFAANGREPALNTALLLLRRKG